MKRNQNLEILALVSAILWSTNSAQAQIRETAEQITVRAEALNNQGVDALEIGKFVEAINFFRKQFTYVPPTQSLTEISARDFITPDNLKMRRHL